MRERAKILLSLALLERGYLAADDFIFTFCRVNVDVNDDYRGHLNFFGTSFVEDNVYVVVTHFLMLIEKIY